MPETPEADLSKNVLYVGHSLITGLRNVMQDIISNSGGTGWVQEQNIPGSPLRFNWDNGLNAPNTGNSRSILAEGQTDVLIITEAIALANHVRWNDSSGYAARYFNLAVESNPDAQVFLYETWHDLRSGTGVDVPWDDGDSVSWRERVAQDLSVWEGIVADVNAQRAPGTPEMKLIPVGQAMGALYDAIEAGEVPGASSIRDFFMDDIHYNDPATYFVAMVQYMSIHGEIPVYDTFDATNQWGNFTYEAPTPAQIDVMTRIAWDTVSSYYGFEESDVGPAPGTDGNDLIEGTDADDTIDGAAGNDTIDGGAGNDTISGGTGDDVLVGGAGNDGLYGGGGTDRVVLSGESAAYILRLEGAGYRITGPDGSDLLIDIEELDLGSGQAVRLSDLTPDADGVLAWPGDPVVVDPPVDVDPPVTTGPQADVSGWARPLSSFNARQDFGIATIYDGNSTVELTDNAWKTIAVDQTVTSDTYLSFEFRSNVEGEIHAIGFDNDDAQSRDWLFQLDGQQAYGLQGENGQYTTGSGWQSYTIHVGEYFQGDFDRLVMVMDDDRGAGADSAFRNIMLGGSELAASAAQGPALEVNGVASPLTAFTLTQDFGFGTVSDNDTTVKLTENAWKSVPVEATITAGTSLSFDFRSDVQGEIHGIGFDNDNTQSEEWFFHLDGTQTYGLQGESGQYTTGSGWQSYTIDVGTYFQGDFDRLVLVMDDDQGFGADSMFRNIQIEETGIASQDLGADLLIF